MNLSRLRAMDFRLLVVGFVICLAWIGIGVRLFTIQSAEAAYEELGEQQRLREEPIAADRGTIYDRNGAELAMTIDAPTIYANPSEIDDPMTMARYVSALTNGDVEVLADRFGRDASFVYVARQVSQAIADRVAEAALPGIYLTTEKHRVYPAGVAGQVLGLVQVDDASGIEGLELQFDELLAGTPGSLLIERDPYGHPIPQGRYEVEPATPGADIVLTIDREIQHSAEQALAAAVNATGADSGTVVVLDPSTGEILALANAPLVDTSQRSTFGTEAFRNRAAVDVFEPGSTLKVVTVAAAIEEGLITPSSLLGVPAEIEIHDKTYEDVGNHPPTLSVADIVAYSSNVGTILIQQQLGNQKHYEYLADFGLGTIASGDFPAEAPGLLRPISDWCATTCGPSTAIGYRVDVTALQMAGVFATLANDGQWIQPHIVSRVVDGDGVVHIYEPGTRTVVSPTTAARMREMLQGVVDSGTGWRASIEGYTVAGKTGTTEKFLPEEKAYSSTDRVASFIGMAPAVNPAVVVVVVLDSPSGQAEDGGDLRFGGVSAAPVFAEVAEAALHRLGVAPDDR